jgi:AcrR family transcriptional regulator
MKDNESRMDGRTSIIIAAEALFAEYGLHGVSFRQISEAANQKNSSAIQYHFGTRDQLVEAVFKYRMERINPRRLKMLEEVERTGRASDARALVSVWIWPFAEQLKTGQEESRYFQFLAHAAKEKQLALQLAPMNLMSGWIRVAEYLQKLMVPLPEDVISTRLVAASDQCVSCMAVFEAEQSVKSPKFELQVETLIDMITAGVMTPMSASCRAAVTGLHRGRSVHKAI